MFEKKAKLERAIAAGLDDPVRLREAKADLDTVNAQIAEVLPNSQQLRILLDPEWGPWLGQPIWKLLPPPLVQHWPFEFLVVYATDLALLLMIGRVPLAYNYRNLVVRWRIAGLAALAFTVVVGLLVALLAFVNGMYKLNEGTGIPGNVFVLSDGATDELFSNLSHGDTDNAMKQVATLDPEGNPLETPVGWAVKKKNSCSRRSRARSRRPGSRRRTWGARRFTSSSASRCRRRRASRRAAGC